MTNLTPPFGLFVDVKNSREYLTEIEGSIENSSIRQGEGWTDNLEAGLAYWEKKQGYAPPVQLQVRKKKK